MKCPCWNDPVLCINPPTRLSRVDNHWLSCLVSWTLISGTSVRVLMAIERKGLCHFRQPRRYLWQNKEVCVHHTYISVHFLSVKNGWQSHKGFIPTVDRIFEPQWLERFWSFPEMAPTLCHSHQMHRRQPFIILLDDHHSHKTLKAIKIYWRSELFGAFCPKLWGVLPQEWRKTPIFFFIIIIITVLFFSVRLSFWYLIAQADLKSMHPV